MLTEIKLPELGENVDSGDLVKVLVSVGETIAKDQGLIEIETEKANIEVPSSVSGTVKQIHVKEGQRLKVGQLLVTVENDDQATRDNTGATKEKAPAAMERNEKRETPQPPKEAQTGKKVQGAQPPKTDEKPTSKQIETQPNATEETEQGRSAELSSNTIEEHPGTVPAAPSIRRLARELGLDIHRIRGSGPGGRIEEEDVKHFARGIISGTTSAEPATSFKLPDFSKWGAIERKPMGSVRRSTAQHLTQAWRTVPQVTQFDRADITELDALRARLSERARGAGTRITLTAIAVKVTAFGLQKFPQFRASVDMEAEEIIYKKYCHVGVAVDTDRGLMVPVIRDADRKGILRLAGDLDELSKKAKDKKLSPDELAGGVFTITNIGGIGGTGFSPIVNYPEVAILGIARASREAKLVEGSFQSRLIVPLSLSYDHRAVDGADAARFLRWIAEALEEPASLLLLD